MHVEPARGFRDIAAAQFVDALDVLPAHAVGRHRIFRRLDLGVVLRQQRGDDVIGVDRLGEIIDGAELHRVHRGGDVAVAGEDDAARFGAAALQRGDDVEPVAVAEPHVDHGKGRRGALDLQQPVGDEFAVVTAKPRLFQRLGEPLQKRAVVLDDQHGAVAGKRPLAAVAIVVHGNVHVHLAVRLSAWLILSHLLPRTRA